MLGSMRICQTQVEHMQAWCIRDTLERIDLSLGNAMRSVVQWEVAPNCTQAHRTFVRQFPIQREEFGNVSAFISLQLFLRGHRAVRWDLRTASSTVKT
jgi:hypothetical protein